MWCRVRVWLTISSLALLLLGCTPKAPAVPPVASETPKSAVTNAPGSSRPPGTPAPAPQIGRIFDDSLLRGKEFLLSAGAHRQAQIAADDVLGNLADEAEGVVKAARRLTQNLAQKKEVVDLAPRWKEYLQIKLVRWSTGPWNWNQVRFAAPLRPEEGGVLIPFLVDGSPSQGRGQIYLSEASEGRWLIEDLLLEPLTNGGPYQPEEVTSGPLVR